MHVNPSILLCLDHSFAELRPMTVAEIDRDQHERDFPGHLLVLLSVQEPTAKLRQAPEPEDPTVPEVTL
jgi:hypothetical protein